MPSPTALWRHTRHDCVQVTCAQPVDRIARDRGRRACQEHGHPRDVAIVLTRLIGRTEHHFVDSEGIKNMTSDQGSQGARREVVGSEV